MVNYIVRLSIRHEVYEDCVAWLKNEHIQDLLALPGFIDAELCLHKGGNMETSSREVLLIYRLKDEEAMKIYMTDHALKYREKGLNKFPGQFSAQREIWLESGNIAPK